MKERLIRWLAWKLPKRLVYWAVIRVAAKATTGKYASVEAPALTLWEAIEVWDLDE